MAYDAERIAKATLAWLEADLPGKLDAVEALWLATDPVTLPEPESWHQGHKPTAVELESVSFPLVAVMVVERNPDPDAPSSWGFQTREVVLYIEAYVIDATEEGVDKIANRYAEAIVLMLQSGRVIESAQQVHWEPAVHLSEAMRHPVAIEADLHDAADEDFFKAVRVEVMLSVS